MATKDCTFFVDVNGRQVEMDFDGFRAYLMQDGVMATLAPDITTKRGKKAGFTVTAKRAEAAPARAEAPKARAEAVTEKAEAPAPSELEVSVENLRSLMPKLTKGRAQAIVALMKAMGIPFERIKLARGRVEDLPGGTLKQADVKARDAEYIAAVKAGDTAKAQKMVDEAAKAAGYTSPRVFRGTVGTTPNKLPQSFEAGGGIFFTDNVDVAEIFRYPREYGEVITEVYDEEADEYVSMPSGDVLEAVLRFSNPLILTDNSRVTAQRFTDDTATQSRVIKEAVAQGYDGIVLQDVEEGVGTWTAPGNTYIVFNSAQAKSADPITRDDKGNVIPLSERFQPSTPDIRYQGEVSPLGSIEFLDDLNALISVFEKANFSTVIHEAMHFYRRHMLNTANGFTQDEISRFERWAGAKDGNWSVQAEEKAARAFEKYLRDGIAPIPELKGLFEKVANWMREVYKTITGSPIDIDIPADIRQVFDRIFTLEAERQGKAGETVLRQADTAPAPAVTEAAKRWAGVSRVIPALNPKLTDVMEQYDALTDKLKTAMQGMSLDKIADITPMGKLWARAVTAMPDSTEANVKAWLIEHTAVELREPLTDSVYDDIAAKMGVSKADLKRRAELGKKLYAQDGPSEVTKPLMTSQGIFKTGEPVLVEAYHGTSQEGIKGYQFAPSFAGALTGAQSAKQGYFFAGSKLTPIHYALDATVSKGFSSGPQVFKFFVKMRSPLVYDMKGTSYREESYADIISKAKRGGHDGVIITNTFDDGPLDNIFIVLHGNENQIKSADPTTYDDAGKPIAIEQRFGESRDIRYQADTEVKTVERNGRKLFQTDVTPEEGPIFTDNILEGLKTWAPKGTPEQLKAHLVKVKGAVAEANWIGLPTFLDGRKSVTRDEVEQFVRENQVNVREVVLAGYRTLFKGYTLAPKASVYHELLLTVPPQSPRLISSPTGKRIFDPTAEKTTRVPEGLTKEQLAKSAAMRTPEPYVHEGHFSQVDNIVVHMRFNERTLEGGQKVLFVEEIQSDWAQAKRRGTTQLATPFQDTPRWTMLAFKRMLRWATDNGYDKIAWTAGTQQAERWGESIPYSGIARPDVTTIEYDLARDPYLPNLYSDTWNLTVNTVDGKVEKYKQVSRATIDREFGVRISEELPYNMSSGTIDVTSLKEEMAAEPKTGVALLAKIAHVQVKSEFDVYRGMRHDLTITYKDKTTEVLKSQSSYKIEQRFGRELAYRLEAGGTFDLDSVAVQELDERDMNALITESQQVSDITRGMQQYYDQIIPKEVGKYVKPLGGQVTREPLETGQRVHVVNVTDKMRETARKGQVLFQKEGETVPRAETATEAYRNAMQERRQKAILAAMKRLKKQARSAPVLKPGLQPRKEITVTPVNRRPFVDTMQSIRELKRKIEGSGRSMAEATDAELDRWELLLNRAEQLSGINPITPDMDKEFTELLPSNRQVFGASDMLEKAAMKAFGLPLTESGSPALNRGWAREMEDIAFWDEDTWVEEPKARAFVAKTLGVAESDIDWNRGIETRIEIIPELQEEEIFLEMATWQIEEFPDDMIVYTSITFPTIIQGEKSDAVFNLLRRYFIQEHASDDQVQDEFSMPALPVRTGQPTLAKVYRGGAFTGTEFDISFLGKLTQAPSAKRGFFFAGNAPTSGRYVQFAEEQMRERMRKATPQERQALEEEKRSIAVRPYFVYMNNPLVVDNMGQKKRLRSFVDLVKKAQRRGHDGLIIKRVFDPELDDIYIVLPGYENQIKLAEAEVRDADGKQIPLSERFNPATKNVLYQGEDPLPNPEGTSTEAFRRKQAEQRQKNLQAAMNRLRQQVGQTTTPPPSGGKAAEPKAAPKTEPKVQARPRATTQARQGEEPKGFPRGFGNRTLDEIFTDYVNRAKQGTLGTAAVPLTERESIENKVKRGLKDVIRAAYELKLQDPSVAAQAGKLAADMIQAMDAKDLVAFQKALNDFNDVVTKSRELIKKSQPPKPKPTKTVSQKYADMSKRVDRPAKSYKAATPEERADMNIKAFLRRLEDNLKTAKMQGVEVSDEMDVDGVTVSRSERFAEAAEAYKAAFLKQDKVAEDAAKQVMRDITDTVYTLLVKKPEMPYWFNFRSPLSYANVVGTYEGVMGTLGREISDRFKTVHSDIARKKVTFGEGLRILREIIRKEYEPLMVQEGYLGMPKVIYAHLDYLQEQLNFNNKLRALRVAQKEHGRFSKEAREARYEFFAGDEMTRGVGWPYIVAMAKSGIYMAKLQFNPKAAGLNYVSLMLSAGPYLSADKMLRILAQAHNPATRNRKVDGELTLRQVAIGETGGRQAEGEGLPVEEKKKSLLEKVDIFRFSSETTRVAGYLVGEEMVRQAEEREAAKARKEGRAPLILSVEAKQRMIRDWIEKVEFDNSPWNMAAFFRGPTRGLFFQFKPYLQKNVERFMADWKRDPEGYVRGDSRWLVGKAVSKLPRDVARRAALIGYQIGFGGISSLLTIVPGLKSVAAFLMFGALYAAAKGAGFGDDDAEETANSLIYGILPVLIFNADISSSLGFFDEPMGKTIDEQLLSYFGGPTVSSGVNVFKKTSELVTEQGKPVPLGGEKERTDTLYRKGTDIVKAITPIVRQGEVIWNTMQGKPDVMYLGKEVPLTKRERFVRLMGGSPLRQTVYFDQKEAYGWQKGLLGKPTGSEPIKQQEGESDKVFFERVKLYNELKGEFWPRLESYPGYQALSPEDKKAVAENLQRNMTEATRMKRVNRALLRPQGLVQRYKESLREKKKGARLRRPLTDEE